MGLDLCRQHAVPPLEARDLSRRHQRSVHRALAEGHQGQGRDPHAVRPRHRHGADRARPARHRAAGDRSAASRSRRSQGVSFAARLRRRRRAEQAPHAVLRDVRPPLASITTAGARSARGRARRSPKSGLAFGAPIDADEADASSTRPAGSSTTSTTTSPRTTTWPTKNRDKLIEMIGTLVRRGRQVRRAADRQPRHAALCRRAAADRRGPHALHLLSRHPDRAAQLCA